MEFLLQHGKKNSGDLKRVSGHSLFPSHTSLLRDTGQKRLLRPRPASSEPRPSSPVCLGPRPRDAGARLGREESRPRGLSVGRHPECTSPLQPGRAGTADLLSKGVCGLAQPGLAFVPGSWPGARGLSSGTVFRDWRFLQGVRPGGGGGSVNCVSRR